MRKWDDETMKKMSHCPIVPLSKKEAENDPLSQEITPW